MYQFICFAYYMHFHISLVRRGDVAEARRNAARGGGIYFFALSFWFLGVLEPLTGVRGLFEEVWQEWLGTRIDPRIGPMLLIAPLSIALIYFFLVKRHDHILEEFRRVKLPKFLWFSLVNMAIGVGFFMLCAASLAWALYSTLALAALWLLVEFCVHVWLKRNTLISSGQER